jgi:UDPglucose 6-dehydrogenase
MFNISVVGSGYVGLVAGACFSDMGNNVACVDIDQKKIDNLNNGIIPIFEPGLEKLIKRNVEEARLTFSTNVKNEIKNSDICFIAVGTPPGEDGSADLQYVLSVAETIGSVIDKFTVVVDKSTVPVGTAAKVSAKIQEQLDKRSVSVAFSVVSNPEFLREGAAIEDFMKPDRVVIGSDNNKASKIMEQLYKPFVQANNKPIMVMDTESAELTKYASNAMLALRISFMNEIANLCEKVGADIENVRRGIGSDFRIGSHFLRAGIGYGGSCFPKDVKAIIKTASDMDYDFKILKATEDVNALQKIRMMDSINNYFKSNLSGKTFALWGLSFKPNTDDMREAPSIVLIDELINAGAKVQAFDPEAMEEAKHILADKVDYKSHRDECLVGADALIIATEWNEFSNPNFVKIKSELASPVIFDGRNMFDLDLMEKHGFDYISIGRRVVKA